MRNHEKEVNVATQRNKHVILRGYGNTMTMVAKFWQIFRYSARL